MNKRMTVDLGMLISFLVLLDYRLVRNFGHETLALVFFLLFLLHTWFNRQWYASLTRGRWNTDRKLTFLTDLLLLGSFAAVMASGFMISHTLPTGMQRAPSGSPDSSCGRLCHGHCPGIPSGTSLEHHSSPAGEGNGIF